MLTTAKMVNTVISATLALLLPSSLLSALICSLVIVIFTANKYENLCN